MDGGGNGFEQVVSPEIPFVPLGLWGALGRFFHGLAPLATSFRPVGTSGTLLRLFHDLVPLGLNSCGGV
jgi:hypothetical protein